MKDIKCFDYTTNKTKRKLIGKMIDKLEKKDKEIEKLNNIINDLEDRIDIAIEYLERLWYYEDLGAYQLEEVKQMLKGEDNKYEIPQFEGTLEQLDKLSISGEEDER